MIVETSNYISLKSITENFSEALTSSVKAFEGRYKSLLSIDDKTQLRKTVIRLYEYDKVILPKPLVSVSHSFPERLLNCTYHRPCNLYICPACRKTRQVYAAERATDKFLDKGHENLRFITVLLPAIRDVDGYHNSIKTYRRKITRAFDKECSNCSFMGAFEIDHKIPNNFWLTGIRTKELYNALGIDNFKLDWFIPHLHMICSINHPDLVRSIKDALSKSVWNYDLPPRSIRIEKFRKTKGKQLNRGPVLAVDQTLKETLERTSHYMFKARLQYTWQQYEQTSTKVSSNDSNNKTIRTAYSNRTYNLMPMLSLVKEIDENGGFKGMKYDYGLVKRGRVL